MQTPPINTIDGSWARTNEQKASRFAEHLQKIFQPHAAHSNEALPHVTQQDCAEIPLTSPAEIKREIKTNIYPKKAPGFDLITGQILKELPTKALVKLTNLLNASFRLKYVSQLWKVAEVIIIPKPGKPPHDGTSYRPISLLPVLSKLFGKLMLKRLELIIEEKKLIPDHQFGFRNQHSMIDQVHRITTIIEQSSEEKKVCSTIFLDVTQAFEKSLA
jgi:hypothetical protein